MKIKNRLSLYFTLICSVVILFGMLAVYIGFQRSVRSAFFERVKERNGIVASLYLEADEISVSELDSIKAHLFFKLPGEIYRIYDSRNQGVFVKDDQQYWPSSLINEVRKRGYLQYMDGESQVVGKFYRDNQGDFVVIDAAIDKTGKQRLANLMRILIVVFVVVVVFLFLSGRFLARKILLPIENLNSRIQLIRASNLHLRLQPGKRKDEIQDLALSFNDLLERLENAFTLQGAFVANVTHELRTPLTSIIGNVEVALLQDRETVHYQDILRSVLMDSVRLKQTVTALLELAQIDSDFSRTSQQQLRVDELLWELQAYWSRAQGQDAFLVSFGDMPEDDRLLNVMGNKELLYIAINNVVANGFKYSEGRSVTCSLSVADTTIMMSISDSGSGISESDQTRVFDPFYRAADTVSKPGSGVGLYISHKIIQLFRGRIYVAQSSGTGTTMVIELPVSDSN